MKKYLHIGYPKCASTSLQRAFFAVHPEVFHLGVNAGKYFNAGIQLAVEYEIRCAKMFSYPAKKIKQAFDDGFAAARSASHKKAVGLSSESLSLGYLDGIDVFVRANRIRQVFDGNTLVVVVIRRQDQLLKSLYKQMIIGGMHWEWPLFLDWVWQTRDSGFFAELNYADMIGLYQKLFGKNNVMVIAQEQLTEDTPTVLLALQRRLGVQPHLTELPVIYKSFDLRYYEARRRLNVRIPNGLSRRGPLPPLQRNRFGEDFPVGGGFAQGAVEEIHLGQSLEKMTVSHLQRENPPSLSFSPHPEVESKMHAKWVAWNQKLPTLTGLPVGKWGYLGQNGQLR